MSVKAQADERPLTYGGGGQAELKRLLGELGLIRADMLRLESEAEGELRGLHESHVPSARNLLHYLALRRRDLRELQRQLAAHGLSSLGRSEFHVMHNLESVLTVLHRLTCSGARASGASGNGVGFDEGLRLLEAHTRALLGEEPERGVVRVMVTMPGEAADDYELVRELLTHGMDCMRINCAHDGQAAWARMIENLRRATEETGKACRVLMDLPGPKLRTGPVEPGPRVVKWRPRRDALGQVKEPARVWLTSYEEPAAPPERSDACLPVSGWWLAKLRKGDLVKFFDARGASRSLKVAGAARGGRWAESFQTAYVTTGTTLHLVSPAPGGDAFEADGRVGELPPVEQWIGLRMGDSLTLRRDRQPGSPAAYDRKSRLLRPASVGVTLPEVLDDVREGESIWLDDGKIGGRIRRVRADGVEVEITHARPGGEKLRADKGINLPDSLLRLPPLTEADLEALPFVARHADLVGYSFVRTASDVHALQSRLAELGGADLGLVLKVETRRAFEQLPALLLAAMRSPAAGVMIARGDLAVECGYERLAEVQEEILWVCEAAHMPVIWATQVLERLAKDGVPSRAEITDAAMGERAECVMLNKGPYILEAVRALDDILRRMQSHQTKKRPMLRPLNLAHHFGAP
ncbi:MAG TPA: pyruvate kinase [Pyrinomonadaceae bacterium]